MGKIKLASINIEYLKNFLKNDKRIITKKWVVGSAWVNVIVLILATLISANKIVMAMISLFISVPIIGSLVFFCKKVEQCQKNYFLFTAVYNCLFSVSFNILALHLFRIEIGNQAYGIFALVMLISVVVFFVSYYGCIYKIQHNRYAKKNMAIEAISVGAMGSACLLSKSLRNSFGERIMYGICAVMLAVVFATLSTFIVRYYCCCIVEEQETLLNQK